MSAVRLTLVDVQPEVVSAWTREFAGRGEVKIVLGDILQVAGNAVVSPANSFGGMDGGIDLAYREFFGRQIETRVKEVISRRPEGHLPVGASEVVLTANERIPYLIVAPTVYMPGPAATGSACAAFRAVLRAASRSPQIASGVYCPGLGTGEGGLDAGEAALEMRNAYEGWLRST